MWILFDNTAGLLRLPFERVISLDKFLLIRFQKRYSIITTDITQDNKLLYLLKVYKPYTHA